MSSRCPAANDLLLRKKWHDTIVHVNLSAAYYIVFGPLYSQTLVNVMLFAVGLRSSELEGTVVNASEPLESRSRSTHQASTWAACSCYLRHLGICVPGRSSFAPIETELLTDGDWSESTRSLTSQPHRITANTAQATR